MVTQGAGRRTRRKQCLGGGWGGAQDVQKAEAPKARQVEHTGLPSPSLHRTKALATF